jgi:hypothetical protein
MYCKRLSVNVENSVTKKFDKKAWLKIYKSISWLFSFFEVSNSLSGETFLRSSLLQMKSERRLHIILEEKSDNFNSSLKSYSPQPLLQGYCCVNGLC